MEYAKCILYFIFSVAAAKQQTFINMQKERDVCGVLNGRKNRIYYEFAPHPPRTNKHSHHIAQQASQGLLMWGENIIIFVCAQRRGVNIRS